MDWDRVIYNGTVVNDDGMQRADIYIRDGRVAAVTSERLPGTVGEATDASGRYILPGLIETHVHSRDGRLATGEKEDFRSSTAAAAATGITTVFEMPNCTPTVHSAESLRDLVSVIQPKAHADFCVWGLALGDANLASLPALAEAGCVAFKFFWGYAGDRRDNSLIYNYREGMDNVLPPPDDGQIYRLFRAVKATGKRLGIHAENFSIVRALTQEALATGAQDYAALLRTRPVSCETSIIDTAIDMAKELSMPLHVLHVGVGDGVEHLRRAKADGVDVTAETCTHYLTFTDRDARRCGAVMKTYPLIRTAADRQAVWQGLADGTLDWVCSDHAAPHLRGKAPFLLGCPRRNQRYRGPFSCAAHRCPPRPADAAPRGGDHLRQCGPYLRPLSPQGRYSPRSRRRSGHCGYVRGLHLPSGEDVL